MKTKSTTGRILLMTERPSGNMAFDELGSRDPVEQLAAWALANLSFAQIGMLCDVLKRDAVPPSDPDADDEEIVERGQRVVEGKQAQDTARFDRLFGREPEVREGAVYGKAFGRSTKQATDSALAFDSYDKLFPAPKPALHNFRSEAQEFAPRASGFGADDDGYDALFGDVAK
jgi:hypothetical protein